MSTIKPTDRGPARKIPVKTESVRGTMPGGQEYESLLERDFYTLLDFDVWVAEYYTQPIKIPYRRENGRPAVYYPDVLIHYHPSPDQVTIRRSVLGEVKPSSELAKPSPKLELQLAAGQQFAAAHGWEFKVFSDKDIRTPLLVNANFLSMYLSRVPEPAMETWILEQLFELSRTRVELLLAALYMDKWNQAAVLPYIWHLIAMRRIGADLNEKLTMNSIIWSQQGYD